MEAYKFETTVRQGGVLKIPELNSYANNIVDVFVVFRSPAKPDVKNQSIDDFLKKWGGYFTLTDSDDIRYNALIEKHS